MRHLVQCAAGIALLIGCADSNRSPTDQGTEDHVGPAFAGAEVGWFTVGFGVIDDDSPILVSVGFEEGVTLADVCSANPEDHPNSPNSLAHVVVPPSGAFLAAAHGQDVPVMVYEIEGDFCDGVGETLIASGTARFHFSDKHHTDGRIIQNTGLRGIVDLVGGGQALLVVRSPFYLLPDNSVKFDKTDITLTPL
ncbi:MAG TPA: hypothetical protein VFH40_04015 [Gemmatimonadales bacterium]|nr:hypothetical protein [Gemmatimonadales bacterium]